MTSETAVYPTTYESEGESGQVQWRITAGRHTTWTL